MFMLTFQNLRVCVRELEVGFSMAEQTGGKFISLPLMNDKNILTSDF